MSKESSHQGPKKPYQNGYHKKPSFMQQLNIMDHLLSEIIHEYENLAISVLLALPCKMFNPEFIIIPVSFIGYIYGLSYALKYMVGIAIGVVVCHAIKQKLKRQRPPVREFMFKPQFMCKRDKTMAMPSGDATQAGIFLVAYLYNFDVANGGDPMIRFSIVMTMVNVMLARVYYMYHYIADTVVGMALGMLVGLVIYSI